MKRTIAALLLLAPVTACMLTKNEPQYVATVETRCHSSCTYFVDGQPCAHEPPGDCEAACVQRLEPFRGNDNCLYCILAASGWRGHTCSCDSALGIQTTCQECDYTGNSKGCSSGFSCSSHTSSCSGYFAFPPGGAQCAAMCGVPEDPPDAAVDARADSASPIDAAVDVQSDAADAALDAAGE